MNTRAILLTTLSLASVFLFIYSAYRIRRRSSSVAADLIYGGLFFAVIVPLIMQHINPSLDGSFGLRNTVTVLCPTLGVFMVALGYAVHAHCLPKTRT